MHKLCVVMMGLPARGKSTLAKRVQQGLEQLGSRTEIFNNGNLRRERIGPPSAAPEFFDPGNEYARQQRESLAIVNMERAFDWLQGQGDVAIIDATHSTLRQRDLVRARLGDYPLLFVECVNEDDRLLDLSIQRKTQLPEFAGMGEDLAERSFGQRLAYYEQVYSPFSPEEPGCWLLVDSAASRVLREKPANDLPYYGAIRNIVASRWVRNLYLVRHGESEYNLENRLGGDPPLTGHGVVQAEKLAAHFLNIKIPYIFTSSLRRSYMTARPILENRPGCTWMAFEEFNEINAGICENMRYSDVRERMPGEYAARALDKYGYVYPRGEGYADLRARVATGLRRALFLSAEETLMIIGHQATNRVIVSLLLFQRPEDIPYIYVPQNQYFHITITQRRKLFEMIRYV